MHMVEIELRVREILCAKCAQKKILSFTFCVIAIDPLFKSFALKRLTL
jgi:hypothetical protein